MTTAPGSTPDTYFETMYAGADDPWSYATRWYERRKRAIVLAALPHERFANAFEPACSTGELTALLAARCDHVLASDLSEAAARTAARRLARFENVTVGQARMPEAWPGGRFDLVVLSEIGYYLAPARLYALAARASAAAEADGTIVACHWRHPVAEHVASGDAVHAALDRVIGAAPRLRHLARWRDADFALDVWSARSDSVARLEGLA